MHLSEEVPNNVKAIVESEGVFVPTEGVSDEAMVVYQRMLEGHCMHCDSALADGAAALINQLGVVMLFCGQVCVQDFFNMHWMMEQYDDLSSSAKFRNAASRGAHDG